jgi:biotin operon repressor
MCRVEKAVLKSGFTIRTARWVCELAKELGVAEKKLWKAVWQLARHGIWLEDEDWRLAARLVDLNKYINMVVDYIIRRVASGASAPQAVKELPTAVANAGKLAHIREVLSNLI